MRYKLCCNQCEAAAIQGTACHETGCPHAKKPWVTRTRGFITPVMFPEGEPPEYLRKEGNLNRTIP